MANYIIELKLDDFIQVPDEKDNRDAVIVADLLQKIKNSEVEVNSRIPDHGEEFDNHDDGQEPLFENETFYEIRLALDTSDVDIDVPEAVLQYVYDTLALKPSYISNCYDREYEDFTRTVVEITVQG